MNTVSPELDQRVRDHLAPHQLTSLQWLGKGSLIAHFAEPLNLTASDTRFAPLMLNWTFTFQAQHGGVCLNVPAAWRREPNPNT